MIQLLFSRSNNLGSRLIRGVTWSDYSHVDIITPNNTLIGALWKTGVTEYPISERKHLSSSLLWCTVAVENEGMAYEFLCRQLHKPYDWTALVGILTHRDWQEDDSWFCSELAAASLLVGGCSVVSKPKHRITPQDLLESPFVTPLP